MVNSPSHASPSSRPFAVISARCSSPLIALKPHCGRLFASLPVRLGQSAADGRTTFSPFVLVTGHPDDVPTSLIDQPARCRRSCQASISAGPDMAAMVIHWRDRRQWPERRSSAAGRPRPRPAGRLSRHSFAGDPARRVASLLRPSFSLISGVFPVAVRPPAANAEARSN
jgi:hypothetical protein